jgi:nitrate/TMAO reductase-like tetraheme cytochrome c subunit
MKVKKPLIFCLIALFPVVVFLTQCLNRNQPNDARGQAYAGSATCVSCHKDISASYAHTAHFQTSRQVNFHNTKGNFAAGFNTFGFANKQKVVMEKRDSGLYQSGYIDGKLTETHRMDLAFGGVKAETYLYWKGQELLQLPISYFNTLHNWTNSPGYAPDRINFDRTVVSRCMECHSSYLKEIPQESLYKKAIYFDKNTLIAGIDCERCHGPAAEHVSFHTDNPGERKAKFMVSFKALTRAQKLDACAVCHSGNTEKFLATAFAFKPGDTLANFKVPDFFSRVQDPRKMDVHGNQNGLLAASKCFLMSNMDCTTCHNTHVNERGNAVMYNQRCINCHKTANHNVCKMSFKLGDAAIQNKCIDCHMPAKPSGAINVQTADAKNALPYLVRTHYIAVYPDETKKILAFVQKSISHKN